jgi:hypothetical protein
MAGFSISSCPFASGGKFCLAELDGYLKARAAPADEAPGSSEAHGNISTPKPEPTSGNENMGSVNFWGSLTGGQKRVFRAKAMSGHSRPTPG